MALTMTTDAPRPTPKKAGVPKTIWDLLFTLIIPILVLSPNILGSGISIAENVFGGGTAGNIRAYLLAALIPVAYVIVDFLIHRSVSPIAILGGIIALVRGALAFWYVDGWQFALKDSVPSLLFGLFALASLATRTPLFRVLIDAGSIAEGGESRAATQTAMRDPGVFGALKLATLSYAVVELASSVVNYFVNLRIVTGKFGASDFNAQIAQANAVMRVPGLVLTLMGVALGMFLLQRAVAARYGTGASLLEPEKLVAAMKERGELAG